MLQSILRKRFSIFGEEISGVNSLKFVIFAGLSALAGAAFGQTTFTVTSPTQNKWLGSNNTLTFNGTKAKVSVTVTAVITGPGGSSTVSTTVAPAVDGDFAGSLPINFSQTVAQGSYTIQVTATEPGQTYSPVSLNVRVDTKTPKLLEFRPAQNSFVKGNVPISFRFLEENMKEWRVTVGGADIPNNTGTTETSISLNWDSTSLENDGSQNIALTAKDQADNALNFSIPLTVDRKAPNTTIQFPRADSPIRKNSDINVIIDVTDQFANAVDLTGVDVVIQNTSGVFLTRVPREAWTSSGGSNWRWQGRIRSKVKLPNTFKIVVSTVDKAGNNATRQEVTVTRI
jgi:hypothetical protein